MGFVYCVTSGFVLKAVGPLGDPRMMLIFETHSTSTDNEAGLASGWYDAPLSSTGEEQARALGTRYRHIHLAALYSSDLVRASRTAEIAFGDRDLPLVCDARLRECDYGELTRRPASEIDPTRGAHVDVPFPRGESYRQVLERVSAWLADLEAARPGDAVLVIGHRATFYALEHLVRGVPLEEVIHAPWQWRPGWRYRAK
jgi:2,3-bisphosphoglycerate-dependent phosphoglycerate mutase